MCLDLVEDWGGDLVAVDVLGSNLDRGGDLVLEDVLGGDLDLVDVLCCRLDFVAHNPS